MLFNEALNFFKTCNDALFFWRVGCLFCGSYIDSQLFKQSLIGFFSFNSVIVFLRDFTRKESNAFCHALFPRISGSEFGQPTALIFELNSRIASSRASSSERVTFFADITAATCFKLSSVIDLARMA